LAAHAWDVNIFIWTSRKSVGHETNDRVTVHGDGTRADGRRSKIYARIDKILGSQVGRGSWSLRIKKSNVVDVQAGWLARPGTEAPETQFFFITHGSGAFPVPRVRTVVRGERASRSIVTRTTALWSIWMVASLILAGLGSELVLHKRGGLGFVVSRGSDGSSNIAHPRPGGLDGVYH
jgi:hypothetical protein